MFQTISTSKFKKQNRNQYVSGEPKKEDTKTKSKKTAHKAWEKREKLSNKLAKESSKNMGAIKKEK